ncbi:MAG: alpha-1,2-fucosyltransferase [Verrucomicrobiaceae bacterium]|nr:alpha-1,2-fucosyltransferase [Verrucomicrobiaceae bacterium]
MNTVLVKLSGGMGNQMFQYAAARQLALLNDASVVLDLTGFETYKLHRFSLQHFALNAPVAQKWEVRAAEGKHSVLSKLAFWRKLTAGMPDAGTTFQKVQQQGLGYDASLLEKRGHLHLDGYWQSPRYFDGISGLIREAFQIVTPPSAENAEMARRIADCHSVSLHVRRADYVNNPKTLGVHGACSAAYYDAAVAVISERVSDLRFFIFSDDIPWARENLAFPGEKVFVDFNDASRNYEDLRLMSLCQHHITANSTFSWWGAWLGKPEGITLTPARWFNDESKGPPVDDLVPTGWIRIGGVA